MIYPWSKATDVSECQNIEEVMAKSGTGYIVNKLPSYFVDPVSGNFLKADNDCRPNGFNVTVRVDTNTALGHVGSQYTVLQMSDVFSFLQNLKDEGDLTWHNAGTLDCGCRAWVAAKLTNQTFDIAGNHVECWLFANNSFDGRSKVGFSLIPTVEGAATPVIDRNTKVQTEFIHKGDMAENCRRAASALNSADVYMRNVRERFGKWASKSVTPQKFAELLFPAKAETAGDTAKANVQKMRDGFVAKALSMGKTNTALDGFLVASKLALDGDVSKKTANREVNYMLNIVDGQCKVVKDAQRVADYV